MEVKLILLMNCAIVVNCQPTISNRNDATQECELSIDTKSEMLINLQQEMKSQSEEIRQLVLKQHGNETQAWQEMKSEFEEIRQLVFNETQAMQEMKSEIEEIRQILIQQQNWSRIQQRKTECPFGFDYLPEVDRCFTFVFEGMTWDDAFERCRQVMPGVHLAAITSQRKNDAIVRYLKSQFSRNGIGSPLLPFVGQFSHGVWISGQRRNSDSCQRGNLFVWKTLNGIEIPFSFTNWVAGQPSCQEGENIEACVHIVPSLGHAWNDAMCSTSYFTLCET